MIHIRKISKLKIDPQPLEPLARAVLGSKYELSVVLCGNALSHSLNLKYRGKDKPTNVLSFPLSKGSGELFLNLPYIKKEAPKFDKNLTEHFIYLFIHGLLHLKGMDHGSKMESKEKYFLNLWQKSNEKHRYGARHRHRGHPRGGGGMEAR